MAGTRRTTTAPEERAETPEGAIDASRVPFVSCPTPECPEPTSVVRLPEGWGDRVNEGRSIAIIGCGAPWHYVDEVAPLATAPGIRASMDRPPVRDEVKITRADARRVADEEAAAGTAEGAPGGTMYVVRISPRALANLMALAGIGEVYAEMEPVS